MGRPSFAIIISEIFHFDINNIDKNYANFKYHNLYTIVQGDYR